MLSLFSSKKFANMVIDDYVVRVIESNGQLENITHLKERPLPAGLIEDGKILDEIKLYDFMKSLVSDWKLRRYRLRFYVPESMVIMRQVEFPANLQGDALIDHFLFEFGQTIHLPFSDPVFDIHVHPHQQEEDKKRTGMLFAAPAEEVKKYTHLFEDVSLFPEAADVRPLGIYRYFHELDLNRRGEVYLVLELNLLSLNISIFHEGEMEFTRYQDLEIDRSAWDFRETEKDFFDWRFTGSEDEMVRILDSQVQELDRIISFYRYSLHKGKQSISQFVLTGDHPYLSQMEKMISQQYDMPVRQLKGFLSPAKDEKVDIRFVPALGLALKGGQ